MTLAEGLVNEEVRNNYTNLHRQTREQQQDYMNKLVFLVSPPGEDVGER